MALEQLISLASRHGLGEARVVCPFCSPERKNKKSKDMNLTVYDDRVVYMCHHCNQSGAARLQQDRPHQPKRKVTMPAAKPLNTAPKLSAPLVDWLSNERGISAATAEYAGCMEATSWFGRLKAERPAIVFGYLNRGEAYAHKIRAYPEKDFSCNGAPQTLYNSNNISDWSEIVITEGEFDVLSCIEAGIKNSVSLPNGAWKPPLDRYGQPKDREDDNAKLRFLRHHSKELSKTTKAIIFTDNDEPGNFVAEEIARRIGRDRCWRVVPPEGCKDANDILMKLGASALRKAIEDAEPWPIEGLHDASHFTKQVMDMWAKGLGSGAATGLPSLDQLYSVTPGQLTVVTGHPGNGKSELVDQIMVHLAEKEGWRFGVCSFENEPRLHISNLISKFIGLPFFDGPGGRMNEAQRDAGFKFVHRHFSFLYNDGDDLTTLDSIIERLRVAVLRHGIKGCVIDPYNYIARPKDKSETEWVSDMLSRVRKFAQAHGIHVFFVAHPTKMMRNADGKIGVPKGNDISGSAAWWAKADMGLSVHRSDPGNTTTTELHVWKSRFSWCGKQGSAEVYFNEHAHRFVEIGDIVRPKMFKA